MTTSQEWADRLAHSPIPEPVGVMPRTITLEPVGSSMRTIWLDEQPVGHVLKIDQRQWEAILYRTRKRRVGSDAMIAAMLVIGG